MKKLLAEYEIRFHDTDEILESSAFNPKDFVNKYAINPVTEEVEIVNKIRQMIIVNSKRLFNIVLVF